MATEEIAQALQAFEGFDQGVFLEWLEGLSDMIHSRGDPAMMAKGTVGIVGGLMYALVQAATELGDRERKEAKP